LVVGRVIASHGDHGRVLEPLTHPVLPSLVALVRERGDANSQFVTVEADGVHSGRNNRAGRLGRR
jgi:nickel-dependent lactate racemase